MPPLDHLGIIAGNGIYPQVLAKAARLAGVKKISAVAFTNETDPKLMELVDQIEWLRVGELNRLLSLFRESLLREIFSISIRIGAPFCCLRN